MLVAKHPLLNDELSRMSREYIKSAPSFLSSLLIVEGQRLYVIGEAEHNGGLRWHIASGYLDRFTIQAPGDLPELHTYCPPKIEKADLSEFVDLARQGTPRFINVYR